jgi:hypothetical protein
VRAAARALADALEVEYPDTPSTRDGGGGLEPAEEQPAPPPPRRAAPRLLCGGGAGEGRNSLFDALYAATSGRRDRLTPGHLLLRLAPPLLAAAAPGGGLSPRAAVVVRALVERGEAVFTPREPEVGRAVVAALAAAARSSGVGELRVFDDAEALRDNLAAWLEVAAAEGVGAAAALAAMPLILFHCGHAKYRAVSVQGCLRRVRSAARAAVNAAGRGTAYDTPA